MTFLGVCPRFVVLQVSVSVGGGTTGTVVGCI